MAVLLSDYKYRSTGKRVQYFVLPDQKERLLVLSPQDIERLKSVGEIRFRSLTRRKAVYRQRKDGTVRRVKTRVKIIGRKAFGISMMNHSVTLGDVTKECFYHTPLDSRGGLSRAEMERKRREWEVYIAHMRSVQKLNPRKK